MHVLLIHQAFATEQEAGGTRHYELARHLVQQGHRVTIIASSVSYLTGQVLPSVRGHRTVREQLDGIEVLRTWTYAGLHRSFFTRVLSFLSFMFSSFVGALQVSNVDIVWGTSPPIFQAVTAYVVARLKRVPFVFEVRDLWPDFAIETGVLRNPLLIWASRRLERFLYHHADRLTVNSPGFIPHLRRCGVPEEKIDLVPNGVEVSMFDPTNRGEAIRQELGLENKFIALYAGAHGLANDLGTVLLAAKRLEAYPDIVFVLVGDGKERPNLICQAEELGLSNVRFVPAQPKTRMPQFLAAADVCIAILKLIPMFTTTYPNKVFDYMAAGRPTVLAIDGVIREVIEAADGGTFVQPGDSAALAEAVLRYYRDPDLRHRHGQNARSYVAAHFDRSQQAPKLEDTFQRVYREKRTNRGIALALKRAFDIVVSLTALTLLSPLMALIALAIRLSMGTPVLFRQPRLGYQGRPFVLYKFRTMNDNRDEQGNLLPDEQRLTRLGRFLRSLTLDELPELFNVLRGEMSLVGPRPLLVDYRDLYTPEQWRRHEMPPGMAGPVLADGRNALDWEEKFKRDVWYVDHWSLWLDFKILARTAWKVLKREGVSAEGHVTMPKFTGSKGVSAEPQKAEWCGS
jgi:lipopolysaccharide/colanic/teichoic acid biosynthesis glycosyltransferase